MEGDGKDSENLKLKLRCHLTIIYTCKVDTALYSISESNELYLAFKAMEGGFNSRGEILGRAAVFAVFVGVLACVWRSEQTSHSHS